MCYYFPETFSGGTKWGLIIIYISFTLNGFLDAGYGGLVNAVLVDITSKENYKVFLFAQKLFKVEPSK